ncbi:MAG: 3-deoxy-7-phosphoheptulonate synthase [Ignavibacteriales bacterium]|nr:3-deoxy-7-phosphoheptulonate synthase [Ignavibacteriales bacterium]
MVIVLQPKATENDIEIVVAKIKQLGLEAHISKGTERTIIGIIGDERKIQREQLALLPKVENVIPILKPYKLVSREFRKENTLVSVDGVNVGGNEIVVMAGPCTVENEEQILSTAETVKSCGAKILRGGAFKPRTSPYAFQGMGEDGLKLLRKAKEKTGLKIVTEVMESNEVELVAEYADLLQVGARNMQNTKLLRTLSKIRKPVLLKRNFSATLMEFLMAAEYLLAGGNDQVILCERGIRTFVEYTRNTFDLNIIPVIKQLSHLPIIADPSHATGKSDLIMPMSRASIACGADGLIIEVHPKPENAVSDGDQSVRADKFAQLMNDIRPIATAIGRTIAI